MTQAPAYHKPLPQPSPISLPYWAAAKRHKLALQRCASCEKFIFYPRAICPHCGSENLAWREASGRGIVYTFTVARRPTMRPFEPDVPYVIAIVELEEGPRMTTNIVGCTPESVHVGMAVQAAFDDVTPEVTLVKFRPAS